MPLADPLSLDSRRPLRVLYADDVRELRDLVRLVVTKEGHAIDCAADGVEALEMLAAHNYAYDLLITDHHMPRMNGRDLTVNVGRSAFRGKIMVFSSELDPAMTAEYQRLKVDRMLFKPVYPSYLRQVLRELFPVPATA